LSNSFKSRFGGDDVAHVVASSPVEFLALGDDGGTRRVTALGHVMAQCRKSVRDYVIAGIVISCILHQ